ncbi:MAG: hypothetical protein EU532_02895 [Promethearchaeota archaeon]|nr:MAG: hypothetical protein EU532_02895 [Candidatus Lokiarchaeota archaeon]
MLENNDLSLEGKMDDWGPFGKNEGKWLIFSMGNPEEGHGYALPRNIDDIVGQYTAQLIALKSGGRYVAHIPWATDYIVDIARDWAPKIIPVEELVENLKAFLTYHIGIYKKMRLPASRIFIYSAHGGNNPLAEFAEDIKKELNLERVLIPSTEDTGKSETLAKNVLERLAMVSSELASNEGEARKLMRIFAKIINGASHASHFEHSAAAALGVLDKEKLKIMNQELERDFDAAIKKWPPIGGLGGYITAGGKYEVLGTKENDEHGHWNCLKILRKLDGGKIKPIKELGEVLIEEVANFYAELLMSDSD